MKNVQDEFEFKVILIGDSLVGKTSIIKRYVYNAFNETMMSTIGMNYCVKSMTLKNEKKIKLKFVDTAGEERFKSLGKNYFANTDAILFVFALNNIESFNNITSWIKIFEDSNANKLGIPRYLVGNKCDLEKEISQDKINEFLEQNNNIFKYKEISAKEENDKIKNFFQEIGERLYEENKNQNRKTSNIKLIDSRKEKSRCALTICVV